MDLIVYPYRRIVTPQHLRRRGIPESMIEEILNGLNFSFHYQVGFPQRYVIVTGEKNGSIEDILNKLEKEADKILVVRHSPLYRQMFEPRGIELGELEELKDDEDYQTFVKGINNLMKK